MHPTEFKQALQALLPLLDAETVLSRIGYKTDSIRQSGTTLRALCPIHKEEMIRSLTIDTTQRQFRCGYARCPGAKGGSLFDLYVLSFEKDPVEALTDWQKILGVGPHRVRMSAPMAEPPQEVVSAEPAAPPVAEVEAAVVEAEATLIEEVSAEVEPNEEEFELIEPLDRQPVMPLPALPAQPFDPRNLGIGSSSLMQGLSDAIDGLDNLDAASNEQPVAVGPTLDEGVAKATELLGKRDYEGALETCRAVLGQAVNGSDRGRLRLIMGRCNHKLERYNQAQRELRTGLDGIGLEPEIEAELRYYLALALEARRDLRSALATLKSLVGDYGDYRDVAAIIRRVERAIESLPPAADRGKVSFV